MFTASDLPFLIALPLLIVASAFFSGSETALFSLSAHEKARLRQAAGPAPAALGVLLRETRSLLITLLMGNMTINALFFVISSMLLIRLGKRVEQPGAAQQTMIAALSLAPLLAIILLGEVLPKQVAAQLATRWSRLCAIPMLLVHRILSPLRLIAALLVITPLARLIAPRRRPPELSGEELESLLDLSQRHGVIDADEERLLQQVLELNQLKVRDLMTPRVDLVAFDLDQPPDMLLALARKNPHTLIPAYRGGLDSIEGVIHRRQALLYPPASGLELNALIRPAVFIPEQQRADRLMSEFRRLDTSLAVVVDEYGGTAGVVSVTDIIDHMTGGLRAPADDHQPPEVVQIQGNRWQVDADLAIHDWPDWFGRGQKLGLRSDHAGISTVGGLVMAMLGRVPAEGDSVVVGNVRFEVTAMRGPRIRQVVIRLAGEPEAEGGAA